MLQILQYQKTGKLFVADLPSPKLRPGGILVRNVASVISTGTERTSVETAQASLISKAKSRPDLAKQVLDNAKKEGVLATYRKVKARLDNYKELGYSSAGVVLATSVAEFRVGDRVACAGVAYHAEEIFVPKNLAVRIPDAVSFESAAFTTLGAIALQGVRQADVRLGETVTVIGIGLIGLLTIQLLKSAGCKVIGLDIVDTNFRLAKDFGCDAVVKSTADALTTTRELTSGHGADAVIITASSKSSEPLALAMHLARKRARVVIVGAVGMEMQRSPFYEKELELRLSCSYGPGRYDPKYEVEGHDYPIGYVRWTENRNMEAVLDLMAQGKVTCAPLVTHRFSIADGLRAYDVVTGRTKERHLAIVIQYPHDYDRASLTVSEPTMTHPPLTAPLRRNIGFIGAGNFAQSYLLPQLRKMDVTLTGVATVNPSHAHKVMEKFGFRFCTTEAEKILDDPSTGTVFIATRHDSHASYVLEALQRGKCVFVEKPLAITHEQLEKIARAWDSAPGAPVLLTGFNRRFSRPWRDLKEWFVGNGEPMTILYRINAGALPSTHWLLSDEQGGRIVGEVCHFVDCLQFITGNKPVRVFAESARKSQLGSLYGDDSAVTIRFADGSVGTILYVANGDPSLDKEYCEISAGGRTAIMKNFFESIFMHDRKSSRKRYDRTKGHKEEVQHFLDLLNGTAEPILPVQTQLDVMRATLLAADSIREGRPLDV